VGIENPCYLALIVKDGDESVETELAVWRRNRERTLELRTGSVHDASTSPMARV
jgi:hypothetical protein